MQICFINKQYCFAIQVYPVGKLHPFFHSQPDLKALKKIYYRERLNKYLLCLLWISVYVQVEEA